MHVGKKLWLRAHVERCLQDIWEIGRLEVDGDGDYPFRWGSAACWVSVHTQLKPMTVDVFAHAALDVPRTAKLLREINEVNTSSRLASVMWSGGVVVVRSAVLAASVDREQLHHSLIAVGSLADEIGPLMASVYGGHTPFPPLQAATSEGECA